MAEMIAARDSVLAWTLVLSLRPIHYLSYHKWLSVLSCIVYVYLEWLKPLW